MGNIMEILQRIQDLQLENIRKSRDILHAFINARELEKEAFNHFHDGLRAIVKDLRGLDEIEQKKLDSWADMEAEKHREVA